MKHALTYAFRDRKVKKRTKRQEWQRIINAACREQGLPYNKFIHGLKEKKVELDRKILADLAANEPEAFKKIVEEVK